jgi:hypothetical protein
MEGSSFSSSKLALSLYKKTGIIRKNPGHWFKTDLTEFLLAFHFRVSPDHYEKISPECKQKSAVGMQFANQLVKTGKNLVEKSGFNRRWFKPAGWFSEH